LTKWAGRAFPGLFHLVLDLRMPNLKKAGHQQDSQAAPFLGNTTLVALSFSINHDFLPIFLVK